MHPKGSLGTRKSGSCALRIPEQDPSALTSSCHLPSSATNEQERVWGPARVSSCLNFSHAERTARELRGTRHRGPEAAPVGGVFRMFGLVSAQVISIRAVIIHIWPFYLLLMGLVINAAPRAQPTPDSPWKW